MYSLENQAVPVGGTGRSVQLCKHGSNVDVDDFPVQEQQLGTEVTGQWH